MAHLTLELLRGVVSGAELGQGVGEAVEVGAQLLGRAAALGSLGDAVGAGDAGDEGRVLDEALVSLRVEEVVADGGAWAVHLGGQEGVDLAGDAHVPHGAGGGFRGRCDGGLYILLVSPYLSWGFRAYHCIWIL